MADANGDDMSLLLLNANSLHIPLADRSVHCCVTSPPYWGLRDYGISNQLGLEAVPDCLGWATHAPCGECYICHTVAWAREVKRVLRDDGTFWLNLGDTYAGSWGSMSYPGGSIAARRFGGDNQENVGRPVNSRLSGNLKPKDLCGIPWRVALALQADGWYLRSDIIWSKPNPMPESVTDRPTKAHEYLFLLAKSERYYYDADAVRETMSEATKERDRNGFNGAFKGQFRGTPGEERWQDGRPISEPHFYNGAGRNHRTVWSIATAPYSGAHFATYPPALVEPCIKAGTSERGCCPKCGKGWKRVVEDGFKAHDGNTYTKYPDGWDTEPGAHGTVHRKGRSNGTAAKRLALLRQAARENGGEYSNTRSTTGWSPACTHAAEPVPCTVLDPFAGSGTTLMVARQLGRNAVGLDLSLPYLRDQARSRLSLSQLEAWTNGRNVEVIDLGPLFDEVA